MIKYCRFFLTFSLFLFSPFASAADYMWGNQVIGYVYSSPTAACTALIARYVQQGSLPPDSVFKGAPFNGTANASCLYSWASSEQSYAGGLTRTGTGCTAPATYNAATQSCETPPPPQCTAGQKWVIVGPLGRWPKNHKGCAVTLVEVLKCFKSPTGDYCKYEVAYTGAEASGDDPDVSPAPGAPTPPEDGPRTPTPPLEPPPGAGCPKGTTQAGFTASGTPICVGVGSTPDNKGPGTTTVNPPVTSSDGAGGTVSSVTSTTTNADGSVTTTVTTTTTAADGKKTVSASTDTTAAVGGAPGMSDQSQKEKGFCQQNPTLSVCRNSSVGGSCGTITCTGDAVQCATLRSIAIMECRQKEDIDKQKEAGTTLLGDSILKGQDPMAQTIATHMSGESVDLSNPNLDSSGFLSSRSCFPPMNFSVMGRVVSVSFVTVCDAILPLRFAVMAMCSLVGYLIVARSVLGV